MSLVTRRALGIVICLTTAAFAVSVPAHAQLAPTTTGELQTQRNQLLRRIAVLTDGAEASQARFVAAQLRLAEANSQVRWAKEILTDHAVASYIRMVNGVDPEKLPRERMWNQIVGNIDDSVLDRLSEAQSEAEDEKRKAEAEAGASLRATEELNAMRRELENTIALQQNEELAEEAKRNAQARQAAREAARNQSEVGPPSGPKGGERHRMASEQQAALLAAHPFGVVEGLPPGFTPTGQSFAGPASWYGPGFDGATTASGAIFDQEGWTVAHRNLPFGTILLITHGSTTVMALVNDRGPYVAGRVLDLSHGVARALGTVSAGVADVHVEVVQPPAD